MIERYIKEYANACKKEIKGNSLMSNENKTKAISVVDKAVKLRDKGLITADGAIKIILERFSR